MTGEIHTQAAALPYRVNADGNLEVLLVRRVEKAKWGIPKGLLLDPPRTSPEQDEPQASAPGPRGPAEQDASQADDRDSPATPCRGSAPAVSHLQDTARSEAAQEAGALGELSESPIGYFAFKKWGGICHVTVFLMRVTRLLPEYPEQDARLRQWFDLASAAEVARRKAVRNLILDLPHLIEQHPV